MRDGEWATGPVREVSAVVSGLVGTVGAVRVQRSLPSSLPGQVTAVGGRSAATADVELTREAGVSARVGTPWSRRTWPGSGDPVTVDATDGTNTHRLFTGRVDGTQSSFADGGVRVSLVDDTDNLSAQVSESPLFREMPPLSTTGDGRSRMVGLLNAHVANLAARTAGYYNTPPMQGYCLLSVPMIGSTWPERGNLRESYRSSNVGGWARYHPGAFTDYNPGSVYMSDVFASYEPDPWNTPWGGGITEDRPLSITLGARQSQASSSYVECQWVGPSYRRSIRLAVTGSRNIVAQLVHETTGITNVVFIGGGEAGAWEYATLKVRRMSQNVLEWQVTMDTGIVKTARTTSAQTGTIMMDTLWNQAWVRIPQGCGLNGIQIGYPQGQTPAETFRRTFVYRPETPLRNLQVVPALNAVPAADLLNDQAEAESAAVWLDEDGVLRWLGRSRMLSQPVVRELTSSDIADATVRMDAQDVRRKVTVSYTAWATRVTRRSSIVLHEGSQDEYVDGDYAEQIITPPSDEQWVQVDSTLRQIYGGIGVQRFNDGQGSFHGYTALTKDGDEISHARGGLSQWTFEPIGPSAWKWTFNVQALPTGADRVKTITRSEDGSDLKGPYKGLGLPLLRGMGVATSSDESASSRALGPRWAPELNVDVGWFFQDQEHAQKQADWLMGELAEQRPTLTGIDILGDPRLQLGDKVRVTEQARTGLTVVGIVTDIDQDYEPGSPSMTVDLMVTQVELSGITWDEFDQGWDGYTLAQADAAHKAHTFTQHDMYPLTE